MHSRVSRAKKVAQVIAACLAFLAAAPAAWPQDSNTAARTELKFVYLKHIADIHDALDCANSIRNVIPYSFRVSYDAHANAILLSGTPDQIAQAEKVITALDVPRPTYRITYTFTETDNGQRSGVQHDSLVAATGQETSLKEGSRVPVVSGAAPGSNITYLDLGLIIDVKLNGSPEGLSLNSKVTQSSVAEGKQNPAGVDPVIRQTSIEGIATVEPGKPLKLGTIDVPDSTRHIDVDVVVEPVH